MQRPSLVAVYSNVKGKEEKPEANCPLAGQQGCMDALPEKRGAQGRSEPLRRAPVCDRSGARAGQAALAGAVDVPSILHAFGVLGTGTGSRSGRGQIEGG